MLLSSMLIFMAFAITMLIIVIYAIHKNMAVGIFLASVMTLIGYEVSVPIFNQVSALIIWIMLYMGIIAFVFVLKDKVGEFEK